MPGQTEKNRKKGKGACEHAYQSGQTGCPYLVLVASSFAWPPAASVAAMAVSIALAACPDKPLHTLCATQACCSRLARSSLLVSSSSASNSAGSPVRHAQILLSIKASVRPSVTWPSSLLLGPSRSHHHSTRATVINIIRRCPVQCCLSTAIVSIVVTLPTCRGFGRAGAAAEAAVPLEGVLVFLANHVAWVELALTLYTAPNRNPFSLPPEPKPCNHPPTQWQ